MSALEKIGEEVRANRTCHKNMTIGKSSLGWENDSYLSGDIGNGGWCDVCHPMEAGVARPGSFRLFFDRTRGCKYVLVSLGESLHPESQAMQRRLTDTKSVLRKRPFQGSSRSYIYP